MSPRIALLEKWVTARKRSRDAAAGLLGAVEVELGRARQEAGDRQLRLDALLRGAESELAVARSAAALLRFADERAHAARDLDLARSAVRKVEADHEAKRKIVEERARAVKTAERALERAKEEHRERLDKAEQELSDAHGGRRSASW